MSDQGGDWTEMRDQFEYWISRLSLRTTSVAERLDELRHLAPAASTRSASLGQPPNSGAEALNRSARVP